MKQFLLCYVIAVYIAYYSSLFDSVVRLTRIQRSSPSRPERVQSSLSCTTLSKKDLEIIFLK